jgi:hypothetical protein
MRRLRVDRVECTSVVRVPTSARSSYPDDKPTEFERGFHAGVESNGHDGYWGGLVIGAGVMAVISAIFWSTYK